MHWQTDALPRQSPALASTHPKLVRRVKPLYRLSELETAAFAFLRGIDYIVEECPFAKGATSIAHKEMLNRLEENSPGSKHNFPSASSRRPGRRSSAWRMSRYWSAPRAGR
jgi:tRNA(Ile)-lysidine synthase TilS/MesJ